MNMINNIFCCLDKSENTMLRVDSWHLSGDNEVMIEVIDEGMGTSETIFIPNELALEMAQSILNQLKE